MKRDPARARSFFLWVSFFLGCAVGVETAVRDLQRVGDKLAGQSQVVEPVTAVAAEWQCDGSGSPESGFFTDRQAMRKACVVPLL